MQNLLFKIFDNVHNLEKQILPFNHLLYGRHNIRMSFLFYSYYMNTIYYFM